MVPHLAAREAHQRL
jgi:hypothetical protein